MFSSVKPKHFDGQQSPNPGRQSSTAYIASHFIAAIKGLGGLGYLNGSIVEIQVKDAFVNTLANFLHNTGYKNFTGSLTPELRAIIRYMETFTEVLSDTAGQFMRMIGESASKLSGFAATSASMLRDGWEKLMSLFGFSGATAENSSIASKGTHRNDGRLGNELLDSGSSELETLWGGFVKRSGGSRDLGQGSNSDYDERF